MRLLPNLEVKPNLSARKPESSTRNSKLASARRLQQNSDKMMGGWKPPMDHTEPPHQLSTLIMNVIMPTLPTTDTSTVCA